MRRMFLSLFLAAALFTLASASESGNDYFLYAFDEAGTSAWSFAVAVNSDKKTLVFTNSNGADDYQDGQALVDIGGSMSKLYREEGKVFQEGELFSWRTEKPVERSLVLEPAQPVQGDEISVFYLGDGESRMSMKTTISQFKIYEDDGTAIFSLAESVSDLRYIPGYALNSEGKCVGVLYKSGIAYSPWYQADSEPEASNPDTDLDDIDEKDPWWKTTLGLSAIAVVIVAAGVGIVLATRGKKRNSGGAPTPGDALPYANPSPDFNGGNAYANPSPDFNGGNAYANPAPDFNGGNAYANSNADSGQTPYGADSTAYRPPAHNLDFGPQRAPTVPADAPTCGLAFKGGALNGAFVPLDSGAATIGRDPSCSVRYPADYTRISRKHALVRVENGQIILWDTSSSGIFRKGSHERLPSNQAIPVRVGEAFYLGGSADCMEIVSL